MAIVYVHLIKKLSLFLSSWWGLAMQFWIQTMQRWKGPAPLSVGKLRDTQARLQFWRVMTPELERCFELALMKFPQEPWCVQQNAKLVIESLGQSQGRVRLMFESGRAECEITVSHTEGKPHYHVQEPTGDVYLARLHSRPQELSTQTLQGVRDALEKWGLLDKKLGTCVKLALAQFRWEPPCVQHNAWMVIRHESKELVFVSGQGECEISVSEGCTEPYYQVRYPTQEVYWKRLRLRPQRLNVGVLAGIQNRLESWGVMTKELRCCFALALEKFPQEPACMQDNPKVHIVWDETKLWLISKDGDFKVSVTCCSGTSRYKVTVKRWAMYRERLRLSAEPLSIERLEAVRSEVECLSGTPKKVKEALNVAVMVFSAEPRCLQKNARLVIECEGEEMVFVSRKGENKVNVCFINTRVSYTVTATKWVVSHKRICKQLCKLNQGLQEKTRQLLDKIIGKIFEKIFHIISNIPLVKALGQALEEIFVKFLEEVIVKVVVELFSKVFRAVLEEVFKTRRL